LIKQQRGERKKKAMITKKTKKKWVKPVAYVSGIKGKREKKRTLKSKIIKGQKRRRKKTNYKERIV